MFLLEREMLRKARRFCTKKASLMATAAKKQIVFRPIHAGDSVKADKITLKLCDQYFARTQMQGNKLFML